ncbi:unnamed protein product [Ambrosiozyma monospora]|uniref:Unnamed protein product n=1 Tax=Ambrosiozyma monospora TaxID=43982 RepID=A0ACB5U3T6_AMBMO|nr:unnamed protein product [Ambrosiozyma monospora]
MVNTNKKREQIDEMLRYIESRLDDLDMEKNDLKEFERLNNKKKVLEFNLLDRELTSLNEQIANIENEYVNSLETTNGMVEKMAQREKQIKKIETKIVELNSNLRLLDIDKKENDSEIQEILGKIGEVTAQLKEEEVNDDSEENILIQLQELKNLIGEKEKQLNTMKPRLEKVTTEEASLKTTLREKQQEQRGLLSKRGRSSQFSNARERNNWLSQEIRNLQQSIETKNRQLTNNKNAQTDLRNRITKLDEAASRLKQSEEVEHELAKVDKELSNIKLQCNELVDERKKLWREESNC